METKTAAAALNGSEYGQVGSPELLAEMKAAGLVAVFGASDDLMEFKGAIRDEVGAYEGTTVYVTCSGLVEMAGECCRHAEAANAKARAEASRIEAFWADEPGLSWSYATDIPHETFEVMEDGEVYCRGIVFALAAARQSSPSSQEAGQ